MTTLNFNDPRDTSDFEDDIDDEEIEPTDMSILYQSEADVS